MKPIATKENCVNCRHHEATHANECLSCHAVTLLMVGTIQEHWEIGEYKKLGDDLARMSVFDFIAEAKASSAVYSWKLGENIYRLAALAKMPANEFKNGVIHRMRENLAEFESIPDKEGWIRRVHKFIGELNMKLTAP